MAVWRERLSDLGAVAGLLVQLCLIGLGANYLFSEDDEESLGTLLGWCLLGTAYATTMLITGVALVRGSAGWLPESAGASAGALASALEAASVDTPPSGWADFSASLS
jgi:hypothetical protein